MLFAAGGTAWDLWEGGSVVLMGCEGTGGRLIALPVTGALSYHCAVAAEN